MKKLVAAMTCLAFLGSIAPLAWAQQAEPAQQEEPMPMPPPPPPGPPGQQPTYGYPPSGYPPPPVYGQPGRYGVPYGPEQTYRTGRRQRTVGMILTFVGIGMGALGFALLYDAKYNTRNSEVDTFMEDLFGIMFTFSGIGCFIPGVILWANGSAKMDEAMQMGAGGMSLLPAPRMAVAPGLTWTVRF